MKNAARLAPDGIVMKATSLQPKLTKRSGISIVPALAAAA